MDLQVLECLDAEDRAEPRQEDEVAREARAPADRADCGLDREEDERGDERHHEGEDDDVGGRRPAHGEELGVLAEELEQRLREREARGGQQLGSPRRNLAEPGRRHVREVGLGGRRGGG